MTELETKIRAEAERLLSEGLVDVVIAFRQEMLRCIRSQHSLPEPKSWKAYPIMACVLIT